MTHAFPQVLELVLTELEPVCISEQEFLTSFFWLEEEENKQNLFAEVSLRGFLLWFFLVSDVWNSTCRTVITKWTDYIPPYRRLHSDPLVQSVLRI